MYTPDTIFNLFDNIERNGWGDAVKSLYSHYPADTLPTVDLQLKIEGGGTIGIEDRLDKAVGHAIIIARREGPDVFIVLTIKADGPWNGHDTYYSLTLNAYNGVVIKDHK